MEEKKVKVFISGCAGRMGKLVVEAVNHHPGWEVCGGTSRCEKRSPYDFEVFDSGNCRAASFFSTSHPDIIIDFSTPIVAEFVYNNYARYYGVPMVCATTKLSEEFITAMKQDNTVPVFQAYNLAYDVYAFVEAVANLVAKLPGCDIDISEVHHKD